jgi:hypothetical protein
LTPDSTLQETRAGFPAFLSDGKRFLARIDRGARSGIYLASLDLPERKLVVNDVISSVLIAPTPAGKTYLLYLRDEELVSQEFDEAAGEVRGAPRRIVENIGRVANPAIVPTAGVSRSGVLAYQTGGNFSSSGLHWFDRQGEPVDGPQLDSSEVTDTLTPRLSPDGHALAVMALPRNGREREVYVLDLARGVPTRLTRSGAVAPMWAGDGNIAFFTAGKIFVKSSNGTGDGTLLGGGIEGLPIDMSADGHVLIYGVRGKLFLRRLAEGTPPISIGPRDGSSRDARMSPDQRWIAYVTDESGRNEVWVQPMPPATGRTHVSKAGGTLPRWSRETDELFFVSNGTLMAVRVGADGSVSSQQTRFPLNAMFGLTDYDITADGKKFVVTAALRDDLPNVPITVVLNWWTELAPH